MTSDIRASASPVLASNSAARSRLITQLAVVLCLLLPIRAVSPVFPSIVSLGQLAALALLPVLLLSMWRDVRTRWVLFILVAILVTATPLLVWTARDHQIDDKATVSALILVVGIALFIGAVKWAGEYLSPAQISALLAIGFLVQTALTPQMWQAQPWKYGFAFPITLLALSLVSRMRTRTTEYVVLAGVVVLSGLNGYRTYAGIAIAIMVVMFASGILFRRLRSNPQRILGLSAVALVGYAAYRLVEWLSLIGVLGERNMLVTQAQIASGGSLLSGGRVETPISIELFLSRPLGYGPGVKPNYSDFLEGYDALNSRGDVGLDRYLESYLFADQIKLHSIAADLWSSFGIFGLILALAFLAVLIGGLFFAISDGSVRAYLIFLLLVNFWNLGFSPIGSNLWELVAGVSVVLVFLTRRNVEHDYRAHRSRDRDRQLQIVTAD